MVKKIFVFALISVLIFNCVALSAQNDTVAVSKRPKVGLVLSGGGAKGMAHIGVLRKLESVGLYPDYITGTSMGSIVGALYSIGYSVDELEDFARNSNWLELMSNTLDTRFISINQKDDLGCFPVEFTFEGGKLIRSSGVIEGQNLSQFFSRKTWCTAGINSFDDYPIPFRCYGVDILKGRQVEFKEGDLAQAIRSSMAIPLVFSPVLIETLADTMLIVDGGVMHNFPVEDVRKMGADIVIGSYTGYDESVTAGEMNSIAKITGRVLMFGGVNDSREQAKMVDKKYLITPNVKGVQPSDFLQADKIIKRGEEAADSIIVDLKKLADSLNAIEPRHRPAPLVRHDSIKISRVIICGIENTDKENAYGIIGIDENQYVSVDMIEDGITRLYSTLLYKSINYSIETTPEGKIALIITVKEKGPAQIDMGIYYDETYNIGFTVKYSRRNFLNKKYDAFVFGNINRHPGIQGQISRNISKNNTLSLSSQLEYFLDFKRLYDNDYKLGEIKFNHFNWDVIGINKAFGSHTKLCASTFYESLYTKVDHKVFSALPDTNSNKYYQFGLRLKMKHNSLDHNIYPKSGARWDIEAKGVLGSYKTVELYERADSVCDRTSYLKINTNFQYAFTVMKDHITILPSASIGIGTDDMNFADQFFIGGYRYNKRYGQIPFAGLKLNQYSTHNYCMSGITLRFQDYTPFGLELLKYVNGLIRLNVMAAYDSLSDIDVLCPSYINGALAEGFLIRTPIGPITFISSNDYKTEKRCFYFSVGFNLPYIK
ncbi:MAG: patatin-like phospholipase family protein [Salinivirgaceae bacterium]|nr:patatin-like phospholipase family protein [Salinivirgaceae bacterium]